MAAPKTPETDPFRVGIIDFQSVDVVHLDGTDPVFKMADVAKGGAVIGTAWGLLYQCYRHPAGPGQFFLSVGNKTALFAAMGAVFAGTTSLAASATGHDRKINYFLGGCVAGSFLGARSNSIAVGAQGCAFFGGLAALRKYFDEKGMEFK